MCEAADRVRGLIRASVIEVGRELLAIKRQLKHGQFVAWVEHDCQLSIRAAQRAMRAAEMVEKNDKLSYLPPDGLLALASRSASKPIVAEIIAQIETGAQPTASDIKRRIAEAVREAMAGRLGQAQGREEPSPEEKLTVLLDAWKRAGREVRGTFLDKIGAILATAVQIEKPAQQTTASSEPPATGSSAIFDYRGIGTSRQGRLSRRRSSGDLGRAKAPVRGHLSHDGPRVSIRRLRAAWPLLA
jgi:hypothetical protein